jgi:uncharacterized membrane protein YhaH (DUF805 family)
LAVYAYRWAQNAEADESLTLIIVGLQYIQTMNPFKGNLDRIGYLLWNIVCLLIITAYGATIDITHGNHKGAFWLAYRIVFVLIYASLSFLIYFKRIRSAGLNDWLMLLWFVPILGGILGLVLFFVPPYDETKAQDSV